MCVWAALVMEWVVVGDHAPRIPGPASCAYICLAFFYLPPPPSHFLLLVRSFHAICCCGRSSGFVDSSPLLPLLPLSWRPAATFCRTTPNSTIITTTTPTLFPSSREVRAQ